MKKLICVICVVLMLVCAASLTACSGNDLDGTYKLVEMISGGEDMTSYLDIIGDVTLTITGDKAVIEISGETTELTVDTKNSSFIDEDGESTPFTLEDNRLTMQNEQSGSKMVFEKLTATADSKTATADSK